VALGAGVPSPTGGVDRGKGRCGEKREKVFLGGGGGGGGGNGVLNEWYLMFQSGMAWSRSLEHYATRGESLCLKTWVIRNGYWPLIISRIASAKAAIYKKKTVFYSAT